MRTTEKRVIGLAKVGGPEDVCSGKGLVVQRQKIEAFCQLNGLVLVAMHHDTPYSMDRGLQRAAEQLSAGLADAVVFFDRTTNSATLLAA